MPDAIKSDDNRRHDKEAASRQGRLRLFAMKLAITLTTVVCLLLGLEIGTRVLTDIQPPLLRNNALLGTTYLPDYEGRIFVPESNQYVDLRFNRDGMRGPNRPRKKPANVRRIAIVGDSMIAAIGTAEEHTSVRVLESLLAETPGHDNFEVLNFGVSGSATGQELVLYREVVRKYEPDVVVCAFCIWNDFGDNCRRLSSSPHRVYFDLSENGELQQLALSKGKSEFSAWLNANSRFYLWQKRATCVAADRAKNKAGMLPKSKLVYDTHPSDDGEYAWRLTEKLLATFQREVERDGRQFVLALLPSSDQLHDENWQRVLDAAGPLAGRLDTDHPARRLNAYCQQVGVPVIDMVAAFRDAAPSRSRGEPDEWQHYHGIGHFNRAGNRLAAEQIHRFLVDDPVGIAIISQPSRRR